MRAQAGNGIEVESPTRLAWAWNEKPGGAPRAMPQKFKIQD